MRYRGLGDTGLQVSEIGFGAWGIGGTTGDARAYGPTDDAVSARALKKAFDLGVTFYDTAALYGYGHSEELIGETLAPVRDRIVISTKVGYLDFSGKQDFSPAHIRRSLEQSLRRLKTDYVDLFQLHDPAIELLTPDGEVLSTLRQLEQEGKIRVAGISTRSPKDSLTAVRELGFKSVQVNFSLVDQRCIELGIFDACRAAGAGIIARTPLCFGFLTGKYENQSYAAGDHRNLWKPEQIACWAKAYQLFATQLAGEGALSHAQNALRYILSFAEVSTTIPGMLTEEHVLENVPASDLGPFAPAELERFAAIYAENRFFV
ncbi:aldo/keto reductase [Geomonas limicola]|uniref:Aldo/keto reductase n=1 Tax=Geomonas limicola TaxID=2740186 RepID=A0A6V8N7H6_9BACT|nr:aldo/keto reductase [Geomonas limicola]GFO68515.1 aldo/keto reductase [Geomonas limicola]